MKSSELRIHRCQNDEKARFELVTLMNLMSYLCDERRGKNYA